MTRYLLLFAAGGCGAVLRFWLSSAVQRLWPGDLPVGTFFVNILGCLLYGFIWALAEGRLVISLENRFLILTGFVGAFTTFSTFAFESQQLWTRQELLLSLTNLAGQCGLGIAAVALGITLGKML